MGIEFKIIEGVKTAIEKSVMTYYDLGADMSPLELLAHINEHLAPAIIDLIANVRRQDVEAVCKACRSENPIVMDSKGRRAHEYEILDDPQFGRSEIVLCRAGPIHDLKEK